MVKSLRRLDDDFDRWYERRVAPTAVGRFVPALYKWAGQHASVGKFAVVVLLMLMVAVSAVQGGDALGSFVLLLVAATFAVVALLLRRSNRL